MVFELAIDERVMFLKPWQELAPQFTCGANAGMFAPHLGIEVRNVLPELRVPCPIQLERGAFGDIHLHLLGIEKLDRSHSCVAECVVDFAIGLGMQQDFAKLDETFLQDGIHLLKTTGMRHGKRIRFHPSDEHALS